MACKYCLENDLQDDFRYCPKCGERVEIIRGLQFIRELAETSLKIVKGDLVMDENGNVLEFEREPFEVGTFELGKHPLRTFDYQNVDITRETIWLEANAIINGGTDDEDVQ